MSGTFPGSPRSAALPSGCAPLDKVNDNPEGAVEDRPDDEGAEALIELPNNDGN